MQQRLGDSDELGASCHWLRNRVLRLSPEESTGSASSTSTSILVSDVSKPSPYGRRRRFNLLDLAAETVNVLDQDLDYGGRPLVATLQLLNSRSDVFVGRHKFAQADKGADDSFQGPVDCLGLTKASQRHVR
jgi:hypothetical protein